MVCENFRPGTMEDWGLGPGDLDPRLVFVRISAFGQDGPYAQRPGLDRLGVAYGGLLHLTGEPDRPPVRPGVTVADYLTGVFAAEAALAALYRRDATRGATGARRGTAAPGRGHRRVAVRVGAAHPGMDDPRLRPPRAPCGHARATACRTRRRSTTTPPRTAATCAWWPGSDANFGRLCRGHGPARPARRPPLRHPGRPGPQRGHHQRRWWREWTAAHTAAEVEEALHRRTTCPWPPPTRARDIALDPHFAARHDLVAVDDPVLGPLRQQAPYPRLVGESTPRPAGAPTLGAHNARCGATWSGWTPPSSRTCRPRGSCDDRARDRDAIVPDAEEDL